MNPVQPNNISLKFQKFKSSSSKTIGIRQFHFVENLFLESDVLYKNVILKAKKDWYDAWTSQNLRIWILTFTLNIAILIHLKEMDQVNSYNSLTLKVKENLWSLIFFG